MKLKRILLASSLIVCGLSQGVYAFAQTNFFRPYDSALRLSDSKKSSFMFGVQDEYGSKSTGRNWDNKRRDVLALHDDCQHAIPMLENACSQEVALLHKNLFACKGLEDRGKFDDINDAGFFKFCGDYREINLNFVGSYKLPIKKLPGTFSLNAYIPIIKKEVHGVKIEDLTKIYPNDKDNTNCFAARLKSKVTDKLQENVKEWSCLDLCDWDETGLGDLALILTWYKRFRQDKEYLKTVGIHAKAGVTFPTGKEKDENKAFSMPLGFDGAWAIPFGVGLELDFIYKIRVGIDADFVAVLDESRQRRMKTSMAQTEFLLLNTGHATKEYGLIWQFHLYAQWLHFFGGLSAKCGYQFVKQDENRLIPKKNSFDYTMVNTAHNLDEWNTHNIIFSLSYDSFVDSPTWKFFPQVSVFYKLPVGGKNVIDSPTFGGQLAVSF